MSTRIEEKKLANGVTLIAKHIPGVKWQLCSFVIHAGAGSDPKALPGLAHFVEHMVSANHSMETVDIKNFFREQGGYIELGSTGFFSTSYMFKLPARQDAIVRGLSIVRELVGEISFARHIERERTVILSEYNTRFPVPKLKELRDRIMSILRRGTVVESRNRPLGEEHAIRAISYEDLQNFYDTYYHAGNLTVLTCGSYTADEMERHLEQSGFLGLVSRGERPAYEPVREFSPRQETYIQYNLSDYLSFSDQKPVSNYESHLVLPIGTNNEALGIAAQMLSKVLFEHVREKHGLVYDVRASKYHFRVTLNLSITAQNFEASKLDKLKGMVEECIASAGSDEKLFEFIKQSTINRLNMLDVTGKDQLEIAESDLVYEQQVLDLEEEIGLYEKVTFNKVEEIFALMKPENRLTVVELP